MKEPMVIIGGGGHAKVVASLLIKSELYTLLGYVDKHNKGLLLDHYYLGTDDNLSEILEKHPNYNAAIGIGSVGVNKHREDVLNLLKKKGFKCPSIVSPNAVINKAVHIGEATVICDGAVIQSGVTIGKGVILNTLSGVDHDTKIGDFTHIAPGAIVCGGCRIEDHVFVGVGASIIQGIKVVTESIIGAGATVVSDIDEPGLFGGVPARKIK